MNIKAKSIGVGLTCLAAGAAVVTAVPAWATTLTVHAGGNNDQGGVTPLIMGANHRYTSNAYETWDPATGEVRPDILTKSRQMGLTLLRWPGGTNANTVWWSGTIGANRLCQRDGRVASLGAENNPADDVLEAAHAAFGLDEHMRFVEQLGAQALIMVPFAIGNPIDAANLVEYLNTPAGDGINPNGGIDWAEVRAANGHPAPYKVTRFEIGNEHYHAGQRYWMPQNNDSASPPVRPAVAAYINGADRRITGERLGKLTRRNAAGERVCTGSTGGAGVPSDGTAGQVFDINYPSAVVSTFALRVNGVTWRRVDDLATAAPADKVYELSPHVGQVKFGDGVHGAVPAAGHAVVADYTSTHQGFVDFYRRMKEVDPSIDVCATWAQPSFPALFRELAPAGSKYDCLTAHPYTHFESEKKDDWDSALEAHDWHMISAPEERNKLVELRNAVNANTLTPHPYVAISEYGALWGPPDAVSPFPEYNSSMTHALYMANQWMHWQTLDVPWAAGNALSSDGWYTLLGPDRKGFIYSAEAVTREAVKPMFAARGRQVLTEIVGGPVRDPANADMCDGNAPPSCQDAYPKLRAMATRAPNGTVYVMVVNRSPFQGDDITVDVLIKGFVGNGSATVRQVAPASFTSHNDAETPSAVTLSTRTRSVGTNTFTATFPPFSVTVFVLPPA